MFVGEGPGHDEDMQGLPFVGRAGKLLTQMIEAMGLQREDVYICNVVKCRPPENRKPEDDEVATCSPYLFRQLDVIAPKAIVCLGGDGRADIAEDEGLHLAIPRQVVRLPQHEADGHVSSGLLAAQSRREKRSLEGFAEGHGASGIESEESFQVIRAIRGTGFSLCAV